LQTVELSNTDRTGHG